MSKSASQVAPQYPEVMVEPMPDEEIRDPGFSLNGNGFGKFIGGASKVGASKGDRLAQHSAPRERAEHPSWRGLSRGRPVPAQLRKSKEA